MTAQSQGRVFEKELAEEFGLELVPGSGSVYEELINSNIRYIQENKKWFYLKRNKARIVKHEAQIVKCKQCKKEFPRVKYEIEKYHNGMFCSHKCRAVALCGNNGVTYRRGYKFIRNPDESSPTRYIPEHRIIMEQFIGRKLYQSERVHHKDANKLNNNIENLELWVGGHPYGARANEAELCPCCNGTGLKK